MSPDQDFDEMLLNAKEVSEGLKAMETYIGKEAQAIAELKRQVLSASINMYPMFPLGEHCLTVSLKDGMVVVEPAGGRVDAVGYSDPFDALEHISKQIEEWLEDE